MQISNVKNIKFNVKSSSFYSDVMALLDRYSNMLKKRIVNGDEVDVLIKIRQMSLENENLSANQKESIILKSNKLLNILGYSYADEESKITINNTVIDFTSPIIYVTIKNLLDNYIDDVIKKRINCISNKNELLVLKEMINSSYILTTNQKNDLSQKINRLVELDKCLQEGKTINDYDFYEDVNSILETYLGMLNKNIQLNENDKNNIDNIQRKVFQNELLPNNQKQELLKKINRIMYLAFNTFFLSEMAFYELSNKINYEEINDFLIKYLKYLENNAYKIDINVSLDNLIQLYCKIVSPKKLSNEEKKNLSNKISFIVCSFFDIEDITFYLNSKIRSNKLSIRLANALFAILKESYFKELLFFFSCKAHIDNELKIDIADSFNKYLKVRYFNNYMLTLLSDSSYSLEEMKMFLFILNSSTALKMINVNNIKTLENVIYKLKRNMKSSGNFEYHEMLSQVSSRLKHLFDEVKEKTVIYDIACGKIDFQKNYEEIEINIPFKEKDYPIMNNQHIITIDDDNAQDLDTAFSIRKIDGWYELFVYVTDVPSVLLENRELARIAYNNATSIYCHNLNNYSINMLPQFLSNDILSLNKNGLKNVITFHFLISESGEIKNVEVLKNRILVNYSLNHHKVKNILKSKDDIKIKRDLETLKNLCNVVEKKNNNKKHLENLPNDNLVALTSILVNYYVGENAHLAIYRDKGLYTKENKAYTHSVTPLRRIASDINLGLFLNQLGLFKIDDKDIYLIEDHLDEIINHINEREKVGIYVNSHPVVMKKFFKL